MNTKLKKRLIGVIVFAATWCVSVILAFAGVILVSFALRNNPGMKNLEMGWMAIILVVPPLAAFLISIPSTFFIMRKINRKIDKSKKETLDKNT